MQDQKAAPPVASYAPLAAAPARQSEFAIASICVGALSILWFPLSMFVEMPRITYEYGRVTTVMAVLSVVLAFLAYRQPNRKRSLAHVGIVLGVLALILHVLIVPL